ncbi:MULTISPECIES: hypothetical protein [unclassified Nocardia]|uniref:hypothetical protein n=1 Tax=unclassified Nocardia TaxID=2637762 RepID=UPI0035DB4F60
MPFRPAAIAASSDFYQYAPIVLRGRAEFDVPAERTWREVEEFGWVPIVDATWDTPEPHRPGSRRRLTLGSLLVSNEFVTRFEAGRELAFYIGEMPIPGFRAIAERLTVDEIGPERSAVTYTIAAEPTLLRGLQFRRVTTLTGPLFSFALRRFIGRSIRDDRTDAGRIVDGAEVR